MRRAGLLPRRGRARTAQQPRHHRRGHRDGADRAVFPRRLRALRHVPLRQGRQGAQRRPRHGLPGQARVAEADLRDRRPPPAEPRREAERRRLRLEGRGLDAAQEARPEVGLGERADEPAAGLVGGVAPEPGPRQGRGRLGARDARRRERAERRALRRQGCRPPAAQCGCRRGRDRRAHTRARDLGRGPDREHHPALDLRAPAGRSRS